MLKNQVLSDLFVELGVAFSKAGKRMADVAENGEIVKTDLPAKKEEKSETPAKKTSKKVTEKATTKKTTTKKEESKEESDSDERAWIATNPPKGKTEVAAFRLHWAELTEKQHDQYIAGEIDSLGRSLKSDSKAEESEEVEELDDFGGEDKKTADDVRKALQAFSKKNSKEDALGILAAFGAKKVADLSEDQYEDVIQELS